MHESALVEVLLLFFAIGGFHVGQKLLRRTFPYNNRNRTTNLFLLSVALNILVLVGVGVLVIINRQAAVPFGVAVEAIVVVGLLAVGGGAYGLMEAMDQMVRHEGVPPGILSRAILEKIEELDESDRDEVKELIQDTHGEDAAD